MPTIFSAFVFFFFQFSQFQALTYYYATLKFHTLGLERFLLRKKQFGQEESRRN